MARPTVLVGPDDLLEALDNILIVWVVKVRACAAFDSEDTTGGRLNWMYSTCLLGADALLVCYNISLIIVVILIAFIHH